MRRLEIGPGPERLPGFETLNIIRTPATDHVGDASNPPFAPNTFDEVYSSHCLEHVEWFAVADTVRAWARILKSGGFLEVHTVNAIPLMQSMLDWEEGRDGVKAGKWRDDLHKRHPLLWASGRILSYSKKGDGGANLHRAILTPRYLRECFEAAGLVEIEVVAEPRGPKKHKGINMGLRGRKC